MICRVLSRQANRLNELVQNLLDLSRLEAEAIRFEPTELNVRAKVVALSFSGTNASGSAAH